MSVILKSIHCYKKSYLYSEYQKMFNIRTTISGNPLTINISSEKSGVRINNRNVNIDCEKVTV